MLQAALPGTGAIDAPLLARPTSDLAVEATLRPPSCPGDADGGIAVRGTRGQRPLVFQWSDGTRDSVRTALRAGDYTLTVTDADGCTITETYTLTDPAPIEIVDVLALGVRCFGEETGFALVDAVGGTGELRFEALRAGRSFTLDTLPQGLYTLRVSDSLGCTTEAPLEIPGPREVSVRLTGDTLIRIGTLGAYRARAIGDSVRLRWSFEGQSLDSLVVDQRLAFRPPTDGELLVRAIDSNGCVAAARLPIRLQPVDAPFFPSAFSPNGDGVNDTFGPADDPALVELVRFEIFDRWGGLRYSLRDCPLTGPGRPCDWTGRLDSEEGGDRHDIGTYVYYAQLRLIDSTIVERAGDVTLFR